MTDEIRIKIGELSFDMWLMEKGKHMRYLFTMNDGARSSATLVTKHYEYIDGELQCVGSIGEHVTLEAHKENWRGPYVCWALKGMWGIPM